MSVCVVSEIDQIEQLFNSVGRARQSTDGSEIFEELPGGEAGVHPELLWEVPDVLTNHARRVDDVCPVPQDCSLCRCRERRDDLHQCRLSSTVRPEQPDDTRV